MSVEIEGAEERVAEIEAQAARLRSPGPALAASDADLARVRAAHPGWRTPGSWYTRMLARLEAYVVRGEVLP